MEKNNYEQRLRNIEILIDSIKTNLFLLSHRQINRSMRFVQRGGLLTTEPSQTIQDDSIAIRDLLIKHANGIMPAVQLQGQFGDDPDHEDIDYEKFMKKDFTEKEEVKIERKERLQSIQKTAEMQKAKSLKDKEIKEDEHQD